MHFVLRSRMDEIIASKPEDFFCRQLVYNRATKSADFVAQWKNAHPTDVLSEGRFSACNASRLTNQRLTDGEPHDRR